MRLSGKRLPIASKARTTKGVGLVEVIMGCDIHMHIEIKVNGKWEHYAMPSVDRNYRLFGALAGVRSISEKAIAKPKGFPDDASVVTKIAREDYGVDGHTDSWLDHYEIMELEKRLKSWSEEPAASKSFMQYNLEFGILRQTYCFGNGFTAHWEYNDQRYLPECVDDVRFVFWFDS